MNNENLDEVLAELGLDECTESVAFPEGQLKTPSSRPDRDVGH